MTTHGTPTLMETLKAAVSGRHARIEALPFVTALTRGDLPLESYVAQLRAMAVIHASLDQELGLLEPGQLVVRLPERPSRLAHLRRDLSGLDGLFLPDLRSASAQARALGELIRRCRGGHPADLLGILYVLEGTTLGNQVHLPDVLRTFGAMTEDTAHYYQGYGAETGRHWLAFQAAMNEAPLAPGDRDRVVDTALAAFDHLEALVAALHPVREDDRGFTATALNPEAGDHPVPQDPRILEAALRASARCEAAFPYLGERFKARGQGFARSDAAWLATLMDLPASLVFSQVDWLGRILGNRGIPRLCLERQLVDLHEAIGEAWPEGREAARVLRDAAGQLRAERLRLLPEPEWNRLEQRFDQALEGDLADRFRGTGGLILSAVCDQACGIERAVLSLQPWLTAPARFPPGWVAAVEGLFAQARAIAAG